jgi:hypothetical protein
MANVTLLGDIAFNGLISEQPEKNVERFSMVAPILQEADLVFANLETPVKAGAEYNNEKSIIHYASYEVVKDLLTKLNIGCVSLANNHIYDCKMDGLKATINLLDELGIYHTGAGWKQEHIEPVIIEKEGQRFGFLAYVDKSTNPKTENFPELLINYYSIKRVISDVSKLKGKVDKVICSIHWGIDYSNYYTKRQQEQAYKIINAGVDTIMGHHPHTVQPYEQYNKGIIFYSLGQLCFGDLVWEGNLRALKRKTKTGMLVNFANTELNYPEILTTKELIGNYIILPNICLDNKLKLLRKFNQLKNKNKVVNLLITIKETFIDRIYEYLFGYYRNPLKQTFDINNIRKIRYVFRDFAKHTKISK